MPTGAGHAGPRVAGAEAALALADRGVRSSVLRLSPTVHGDGDTGFVSTYAQIAQDHGVVGYIGDGSNRWAAVRRADAATLFRLAIEKAAPGSVLHGVAEEGIPLRQIAEAIGKRLNLPTQSIAPDAAADHFGWLAGFIAMDAPASSAQTQEQLGWRPTAPTLLDDIESGFYG